MLNVIRKNRKVSSNFNFLSSFDYFIPDGKQLFILFVTLVLGAVLANALSFVLLKFGKEYFSDSITLIAYPIIFVPAMIYAMIVSTDNGFKEKERLALNRHNFGNLGAVFTFIIAILMLFAANLLLDPINNLLPDMPESLKKAFESISNGNVILNLVAVSVLAPFFEEWLCRGIVLRSLLHLRNKEHKHVFKASVAIALSALFFALIHLNPWQAIPAFGIGLLLGYVYYKTGSLILCMTIHSINNASALLLDKFHIFSSDVPLIQSLGKTTYFLSLSIAAIVLISGLYIFSKKIKNLADAF